MTHNTSVFSAGLATAITALLLTGCSDEAPSFADQPVAEETSPVAENVPKKAVDTGIAGQPGDSPGKPVAPIDIDYEVLGEPRPGEPVEIELKLRTSLDGPVTVQLQPRGGLRMGASQTSEFRRETIGTLTEPAAERVVVVPNAEGRFYLSVLVSVATAGGEQIRAVSIPVQVGDQPPTMRQNGELRTTGGETVRSLPAKESGGD